MKRIIVLDNKEYIYDLTFKNMKSIRIRIVGNLIKVSAPRFARIEEIEKLIYENSDKITNAISNYMSYYDIRDGGYLIIFNVKYNIIVRDIKEYRCGIHNNNLYVYHSDINKATAIFMYDTLYDYLNKRVKYYVDNYFNFKYPKIIIKYYKSRWGSCYYKLGKISFNSYLIHLEKDLIDYVIVHELCHFIEPNHSKEFYRQVERILPDYKDRIKRMKEKHL